MKQGLSAKDNVHAKISSYVGFCIKGNMIVYGTDNVLFSKKSKLVFLSDKLSERTKDYLKKRLEVDIIENYDFSKLTVKSGCKVFAITNNGLANAIKDLYETI